MGEDPSTDEIPDGWRAAVAAHPFIVGFMVACTLAGVVLGIYLLPESFSLARRVAGGAVGGASVGFLLTATRMIGAWS